MEHARIADALREENVLALGEADDLLAHLTAAAVPVRLAVLDPPYNRRTRFHHYADSQSRSAWAGDRRRQAAAIRDLLTDDGSLWVHIDDAEMPVMRTLLDEVFGPSSFVATVVWQKTLSRESRTAISTSHEYLLVYAKDRTAWRLARHKTPATPEQLGRYRNPDGDPRGPWTSGDLMAKDRPGRRAAQFYDLTLPSGRVVRPTPGTAWRFTRERWQELVDDDRIWFGDGDSLPRLKRFLAEVEPGLVPDTWWPGDVVGTTASAKRHLKALFPDLVPFETPKPEALVARVVAIASDPGDLVLDLFAGSGTTAAVAHKTGRRWVTVEREERTFTEFTLPRLEAVTKGLDPGGVTLASAWSGGGSFATLTL